MHTKNDRIRGVVVNNVIISKLRFQMLSDFVKLLLNSKHASLPKQDNISVQNLQKPGISGQCVLNWCRSSWWVNFPTFDWFASCPFFLDLMIKRLELLARKNRAWRWNKGGGREKKKAWGWNKEGGNTPTTSIKWDNLR